MKALVLIYLVVFTMFAVPAQQGFVPQAFALTPLITLEGENPQFILVNTPYIELGATADDPEDGDITADIIIDASAVDTSTLGSYTVIYQVTDSDLETDDQERTVIVVDEITWDGNSDDDGDGITWSDPLNWNLNRAPINTDRIKIGTDSVQLDVDFTVDNQIVIESGATLTINSGIVFTISSSGDLSSNGDIINDGTILADGEFTSDGNFINNNTLTTTNTSFVELLGTSINNSIIDANSQLITRGDFTNNGNITNTNQLTIRGNFTNSLGSTVSNIGSGILVNDDEAIFDNFGTIDNFSAIQHYGIFNNHGTVINNGTIAVLAGQFINHSDGTIENELGASIDNQGTFINDGLITNDGIIEYSCGNPITGSGTLSGNAPTENCGDTEPPIFTPNPPPNITQEALGPSGNIVTFVVNATDNLDPSVTVTCAPISGSLFVVGATQVSCEAFDDAGNIASTEFFIIILILLHQQL